MVIANDPLTTEDTESTEEEHTEEISAKQLTIP